MRLSLRRWATDGGARNCAPDHSRQIVHGRSGAALAPRCLSAGGHSLDAAPSRVGDA
ncbi:hypothetical protein KCH_52020 [Kitasatospora cheerisanensis KCTC 2395]|uniref:Uncharacterized protein n=1 Tax=Kitasatospora cheerisanensis KCTC 2395 TaxID=1348663 RepID=A0A066YY96_9ACTN|nr:hypothetical protein KCH_52020 [Kitasatospora cheerisanensis KCTC 2395]